MARNAKQTEADVPKTLLAHLDELRGRFVRCAIVFSVAAVGCYAFSSIALDFLTQNIDKLVFIEPFEAFIVHIKVACFLGLLLSSPYLLFQLWAYIGIAFERQLRRLIVIFLPISFLLFMSGAAFALWAMIPAATQFLLGFSTPKLQPMITVNAYVSFEIMMMIVFGLFFEIPMVLFALVHFKIFTSKSIAKQRKFYIVIIFIAAAILTPGPDVVSQLLLAIPGLILFEAGLLAARIVYRR